VITADTAGGLHELISQDHSRRTAAAGAGAEPDGPGPTGAGERALRRLIDDGVI